MSEEAPYQIQAILSIAAGFLVCFAGYRLLRFSLFSVALLQGGRYLGMVVSVVRYGYLDDGATYWVPFYLGGLFIGVLAAYKTKFGACVTGFCAGVGLAAMILSMANYNNSFTVYLVWTSIGGVVCAVPAAALKKPGVAVAMSFVGATMFISGVSYFVSKSDFKNAIEEMSEGEADDAFAKLNATLRRHMWMLSAIQLALFVVGMLVQFLLTAKGIDHMAPEQVIGDEDATTLQYKPVQTPQKSDMKALGNPIEHVV